MRLQALQLVVKALVPRRGLEVPQQIGDTLAFRPTRVARLLRVTEGKMHGPQAGTGLALGRRDHLDSPLEVGFPPGRPRCDFTDLLRGR